MSVEDGTFSVHCVTIEFEPTFSSSTTDQEPDDDVFDSLICEARRTEGREADIAKKAHGVATGAT